MSEMAGSPCPIEVVKRIQQETSPVSTQSKVDDPVESDLESKVAFERPRLMTVQGVGQASPGLLLEKVGATTGRTQGVVEGAGSYTVEPWGYVITGFQLGPLDASTGAISRLQEIRVPGGATQQPDWGLALTSPEESKKTVAPLRLRATWGPSSTLCK
jgi:hypothetical protein